MVHFTKAQCLKFLLCNQIRHPFTTAVSYNLHVVFDLKILNKH